MTRFQGKISQWDDARGFGAITWNGSTDRLFVHISAFEPGLPRPRLGDIVTYEAAKSPDGRHRAVRVRFASQPGRQSTGQPAKPAPVVVASAKGAGLSWFALVSGLFLVTLSALAIAGRIPRGLMLIYLVMSILSYLNYAIDKRAAAAGRRRIPEARLQTLALLGGWPGAWLAQRCLRHKTIKASFQRSFRLASLANMAALLFCGTPLGRSLLEWVQVV